MLRFLSSPLFSLSLPEVLKAKGFTAEESQTQDLQKQIQRGSECPEICEAVIQQAVLAVHTTTSIPTAIFVSNSEGSLSSLSDEGTPNKTNMRINCDTKHCKKEIPLNSTAGSCAM